MTEKVLFFFQASSWFVCVSINIALYFTNNLKDYFDQNVYLVLIGFCFVIPTLYNVCEAWANAILLTLFT